MKKTIFGMMLMLAACALSGNAVLAQNSKARDLFIQKEKNENKGKPGAKVRILLKRGNDREKYVSPSETFYAGDKIKLAFDINFSGYVALLNVGSSGKISPLYPYKGVTSKIEPSASEQLIPSKSDDWIVFDNTPGSEQITIIFSTNPIQPLQQVAETSGQPASAPVNTSVVAAGSNASGNGTAISGAVNTTVNIGSGSTIYVAGSAEAQAILEELNSRSLKRSKTRDLSIQTVNNDATYVVAESSLISEPTAFVITLKHAAK